MDPMSSESESDADYLPVPEATASRLQSVQHTHNQPASRTDLPVPEAAASQLQCVQHNQPVSVTSKKSCHVSNMLKMSQAREKKSSKFRTTIKRHFGKSLDTAVSLIARSVLRKGENIRVLRDKKNKPYALQVRNLRLRRNSNIALNCIVDLSTIHGPQRMIAEALKMGRTSVHRLKTFGAAVLHRNQTYLVRHVKNKLRKRFFRIFASTKAFDSTSHSMIPPESWVSARSLFKKKIPAQKVPTFLCLQSFVVDCDDEPFELLVVRPPVALVDEDSASYWKALYELDAVAEINAFEQHGFNEATWAVAHHDADGATSNERLLEVRLQRLPEHVLGSKGTCANHRNQLVETAVSAAIGIALVSAWYSFVLFLRMGCS